MGLNVIQDFSILKNHLRLVRGNAISLRVGYFDSDDSKVARDLSQGIRGPVSYESTHGHGTITLCGIPPRPFLKDGIKNSIGDIENLAKTFLEDAMFDKANTDALGQAVVKLIQEFMNNETIYSPNSRIVELDKESFTPLIDTGGLRDRMGYQVTSI